jgi:hypothetical protein
MLEDADAKALGAPKKALRKNGRFDVVVWWGEGYQPRAVIEVKNHVWSYANISKDVERIESVLQRNKENSSFQFGLIACYASAVDNGRSHASAQLERNTKTLLSRIKDNVSDSTKIAMTQGQIYSIQNSAWVATCFVLS